MRDIPRAQIRQQLLAALTQAPTLQGAQLFPDLARAQVLFMSGKAAIPNNLPAITVSFRRDRAVKKSPNSPHLPLHHRLSVRLDCWVEEGTMSLGESGFNLLDGLCLDVKRAIAASQDLAGEAERIHWRRTRFKIKAPVQMDTPPALPAQILLARMHYDIFYFTLPLELPDNLPLPEQILLGISPLIGREHEAQYQPLNGGQDIRASIAGGGK
jgi:hypothetical protein